MRKLILVLNILVMMVCTVWGQVVWDGNKKEDLEYIDGVYHISTAAQLAKLADLVNGGDDFTDKTVILQQDIVLNKDVLNEDGTLASGVPAPHSWTPIGNYDKSFKGTFDGNGHKVSGVYIVDDGTKDAYLGLFGCLGEGGKIEEVGVVDSYVKGGADAYVGGVCGWNDGMISNSYNAGSVEGGKDARVGGVCGYSSYYSSISNSYNTGSVKGGESAYVGGVCGYSDESISDSYNTGSVTGTGESAYVGGVCGWNDELISNSYNAGSVTGTGEYVYVGGVCGYNNGLLSNSYNTGSVTGTEEYARVGGVCGYNEDRLFNSYNVGTVTGAGNDVYVGGVCGRNKRLISSSYNAGSVTGTGNNVYVGGVCGNSVSGDPHSTIPPISNSYNAGLVTGKDGAKVGGVCGYMESNNTANCFYLAGTATSGIGEIKEGEDLPSKKFGSEFIGAIEEWLKIAGDGSWQRELSIEQDKLMLPHLNIGGNAPAIPCPDEPIEVEGYYEIYTATHLRRFATKVNGGDGITATATINGKLMVDIAVSEYTLADGTPSADPQDYWTPIGENYEKSFTGIFDGQGHTVSGVYIVDAAANVNLGLFGALGEGGKIKNVGVVDSYVKGTGKEASVGGVCGFSSGSIEDSYNAGLVEGGEYAFIGGVCGYSVGSILNSYNAGSVKRGEGIDVETEFPKVGGVCGCSEGSILSSYNAGSVEGVGSVISVGGVCGDSFGSISNSYNVGSVKGIGEYADVGGVCGGNSINGTGSSGSILNSYNAGSVEGIGEDVEVGGVCGSSGGSIANSYNTTSVTGGDGASVGGVCGYNHDEEKITDCYYLAGTATSGISAGNGNAAPITAAELIDVMNDEDKGLPEGIWKGRAEYTSPTLTLPAFSEEDRPEVTLATVPADDWKSIINFETEQLQDDLKNYRVTTGSTFADATPLSASAPLTDLIAKNATLYICHLGQVSEVLEYKLARPKAPTTESITTTAITTTSITLAAIEGAQYGIGKEDATIDWQDGVTFDKLTPETEYTIYARIKATESSFASLQSDGVEIATLKESFAITIQEGIVGGSVSADKATATAGETITLTIDPAEGYELTSLKANDEDVTEKDGSYTFEMPAQAVTITAVFTKKTYTVTVSCDSRLGTVVGGGTYEHGATATLTATATSGYHFTQWSSGETANPLTITVTGDLSLAASFEKDPDPEPEPEPEPEPVYYTVTIPSEITGAIIHGGGTHQVREGDYIDFSIEIDPAGTGEYPTVTVDGDWWNTIRPDAWGNYRVWVDDSDCDIRIGEVSGYGTYTLTLPADSLFEGDDLYRSGVGISVTPASSSPSSDALRYPFGTELTLTAVSDRHRAFVEWMDGSRRDRLTFRLREDTEAYAWFRALHPVGNEEIAVASIRIRTERGGSIVIDTPKRLPIAIYALSGQCLRRSESEGTTRFSGLSEGSYLVVVGTHSEVVIVR